MVKARLLLVQYATKLKDELSQQRVRFSPRKERKNKFLSAQNSILH